jgi:MFS transporter, ACDE family, multidrug resistance protein
LFITRSMPDIRPQAPLGLQNYFSGIIKHLKTRASIAVFLAGMMAMLVMFGAYFTYLPFLAQERFGLAPASLGFVMASRSAVAAVLATQFMRIHNLLGFSGMVKVSYILYGLSFVLIPLAGSLLMLAAATISMGLAEGLYWPANHLAIGSLSPSENRGGYITINDSILKIGQFIGPLIMGFAFLWWTASGTFYLSAALLLLTLVVLFLLLRKDTHKTNLLSN